LPTVGIGEQPVVVVGTEGLQRHALVTSRDKNSTAQIKCEDATVAETARYGAARIGLFAAHQRSAIAHGTHRQQGRSHVILGGVFARGDRICSEIRGETAVLEIRPPYDSFGRRLLCLSAQWGGEQQDGKGVGVRSREKGE
jgi:hypothetical protein